MRNLLNNLKTAITSRLRLSRACSCGRANRANNDNSKGKDLVEELSEWDRITKEDSKKERRQKFRHYFQRNSVCMQVTEEDILLNDWDEEERHESDFYRGKLLIPRLVCPMAENCCVICLESYQPGDYVVWSTNADCEHAFHRSCIVKYFDKIQRKVASTPCPCCRSAFTSMTVEVRTKRRQRTVRTVTALSTIISSFYVPWFR